ncbi:Ribonuclease P protein subunit p29 [Nymphon striatum]|nr:Ribonuclease P protein subunit p29 [Nymphon striatum]
MASSNARYDNVSDTLSSSSEISEDEIDLSSCEDYCEEIGGWGKKLDIQNIELKLLKADYHGCHIVVQKSSNYSLIGRKGIVVIERKNIFIIITNDNKLLTLPKRDSVFTFRLDDHIFQIYGENFRQEPERRVKGKFKMKTTIKII